MKKTTAGHKRRTLLKSLATVPVVFTLPMGIARAGTSVSCDAPEHNNTHQIDNIELFEESYGTFRHEDSFVHEGVEYVYDQYNGRIVTASCWNSLVHVQGAAHSDTRLV